jgi:hypothetical protein
MLFFSHLSSVDSRWLSIAVLDMYLIFVVIITYPNAGMNYWVCLFLIIMIFVFPFFFKLILTQRPGYLFAELIGARSVGTSNFIFPSVSPGASVLVKGIRLWNQLPLAIKNVRLRLLRGL